MNRGAQTIEVDVLHGIDDVAIMRCNVERSVMLVRPLVNSMVGGLSKDSSPRKQLLQKGVRESMTDGRCQTHKQRKMHLSTFRILERATGRFSD